MNTTSPVTMGAAHSRLTQSVITNDLAQEGADL